MDTTNYYFEIVEPKLKELGLNPTNIHFAETGSIYFNLDLTPITDTGVLRISLNETLKEWLNDSDREFYDSIEVLIRLSDHSDAYGDSTFNISTPDCPNMDGIDFEDFLIYLQNNFKTDPHPGALLR
jgi:hypothetical protein